MKAAVESDVLDDIREKKDALQEIVQALSMKLYEEAAKQAEAAQGTADGQDDDIVDAEFEEVRTKKIKSKSFRIRKSQSLYYGL